MAEENNDYSLTLFIGRIYECFNVCIFQCVDCLKFLNDEFAVLQLSKKS